MNPQERLQMCFISSEVKHINSLICLELEKLLYNNWKEKFSDHIAYLKNILVEYELVKVVSWKSRLFSNVDFFFERQLGAIQQSHFRKPLWAILLE